VLPSCAAFARPVRRALVHLAGDRHPAAGHAGHGRSAYPGFLSVQVMLNLLIDNAFLLVIAIGMGFVILSGGIDLSVGSVLALSTMLSRPGCCSRALAAGAGDRLRAAAGRLLRRRDGRDHPPVQAAALHRHAGRHVPGARPVLPDQHRVDHHRPAASSWRCRRPRCRSSAASCRRARSSRWLMLLLAIWLAHYTPSAAPCMRSAATSSRPR
jgi:hypothetical protein